MIEFPLTLFESFVAALIFVGCVICAGMIVAGIVDLAKIYKAGKDVPDYSYTWVEITNEAGDGGFLLHKETFDSLQELDEKLEKKGSENERKEETQKS